MYSKQNPPKPKTWMRPYQYVRTEFDFSRDKDHNLIVVESGKKNFDALAAAAAEGCDFKLMKEQLRSGAINLRNDLLALPGKGVEYGFDDMPKDLIDADIVIKKAAAGAREAYAGLPDDLKGGMTLDQFAKAVDAGYFEKYVKMKEAQAKVDAASQEGDK